ncbi:MAG: RluA family pseudouridine synthase [Bacteroidales bacterium]|nr:RluA family pseudouridine synthase [Bacteroidales bacterium]
MLNVIFSDDRLLAVSKPAGITTVPVSRNDPECLLYRVRDHWGGGVLPVHRIDRDVSGIVLFARTPEAHRWLNILFEQRRITKQYLAWVLGVVEDDHIRINLPIRQFGSGRMGVDREKGIPSVTEADVFERKEDITLLGVHPLTGRRHQIRVHLYAAGHPVAGDARYGDKSKQSQWIRLMLHAWRLSWDDPVHGNLLLTDPPPKDFLLHDMPFPLEPLG